MDSAEFASPNLNDVCLDETEEYNRQTASSVFLQPTDTFNSSQSHSPDNHEQSEFDTSRKPPHSVRIIDENENLLFTDATSLGHQLGCPPNLKLKTLAIVGNTGDGKSHTFNNAFCKQRNVFVTSTSQSTCTLGVWAAYEPDKGYLLLDTEGLLGASSNPNRQRRLLLKVFAVADVVIYRTMSDRLHSDMFTFLADASDAFAEHFRPDLENLAHKSDLPWSSSQLGPAVVIFQETKHTEPLDMDPNIRDKDKENACSSYLLGRFGAINRHVDAFSQLYYCGVRTQTPPTNFEPLVTVVDKLMQDTTIRSPRLLAHIFKLFSSLNDNFSCDLPDSDAMTFVQEYFTCPVKCTSCSARCQLGVNHKVEDIPHISRTHNGDGCKYNAALQNKVYFCKKCYANGKSVMLIPKIIEDSDSTVAGVMKYLWSGYLLKCQVHGVIYRSRAHWSGNPPPEDTPDIHFQVVHVWPGEKSLLQGAHPLGQIVLDGFTTVSNQVTQLTAPSARVLTDLIADSVAPPYWQPNAQIKYCACCNYEFPSSSTAIPSPFPSVNCSENFPTDEGTSSALEKRIEPAPSDDAAKHHCRSCGRGVCESCSKHRIPVPERGFSPEPVRVCDRCFHSKKSSGDKEKSTRNSLTASSDRQMSSHLYSMEMSSTTNNQISGRKVIEMLSATAGYFSPVFTAPKEMVKSLARPDYWQPDETCHRCSLCSISFGLRTPIHHCRACGCGVCDRCSQKQMPVPHRGLDWPSRVCDACYQSAHRVPPAAVGTRSIHPSYEVTSTTGPGSGQQRQQFQPHRK